MIKQKLTTAIKHLKAAAAKKAEKLKAYFALIKTNWQFLYLYCFFVFPLAIITSFMSDWIKAAREMDTLTSDLFVSFLLLQGVKLLALDLPFILGEDLGKIGKFISFCLRLLAVYCFGHAVLLMFGVVSL